MFTRAEVMWAITWVCWLAMVATASLAWMVNGSVLGGVFFGTSVSCLSLLYWAVQEHTLEIRGEPLPVPEEERTPMPTHVVKAEPVKAAVPRSKRPEMPKDLINLARVAVIWGGTIYDAHDGIIDAGLKIYTQRRSTCKRVSFAEVEAYKAVYNTQLLEDRFVTRSDLISVTDAARWWGCTAPNIYAKIKSRVLNSCKFSKEGIQMVSKAALVQVKQDTQLGKAAWWSTWRNSS